MGSPTLQTGSAIGATVISNGGAGHVFVPVNAGLALSSGTEANIQTTWRTAGLFSLLWINVIANTSTISTFNFRKGGVNGTESVSVTASTTGFFQDASGSDTVASGDLVNLDWTGGSGGNATAWTWGVVFTATAGLAVQRSGSTFIQSTKSTASTTWWFGCTPGLAANTTNTATESKVQYTLQTSGQFRNLQIRITANTTTSALSLVSRIGGGNGLQSISIAGSTSGTFEDTVNLDNVVAGNLFNLALTSPSGTVGFTLQNLSMEFANSGTAFLVGGTYENGALQSASAFYPAGGGLVGTATEAQAKSLAQVALTYSKFQCQVTTGSTGTVQLRKNGGNATQSISITGTGVFLDNVHTDAIVGTDQVDIGYVFSSASISLSWAIVQAGTGGSVSSGLPNSLSLMGCGT